ncbi:unnamed protein product [Ostreobium quekettii]|uniref:RecF/RecN/SMC N-terminal domain-containing protein n=1 Tax=Ostreobium quekettii TaxID=121088 RepID=A0A8S1IPP1_9CHLO|nr:unnamed protein product [Ostreobium quekettii]|eukprot:evm.model.scf_51.8 EVM.evm.TU.scf_51.8   scf_51:65963-67973(-)
MAGPEGGDNNGEEPIPEHGWIDRLVVQNFKSYRGTHTIGPFKRFVSIVGPNGSGKSNLMDAISFVLGVRTAQLRGSLGELLHTAAKSGARTTEGFVRLVFLTPDGGQVTFERAIVSSGAGPETRFHSRYKIDGRTVDWVSYNGKLESFRILVKARNFLVFQGDIESVAAMAPKDLTNWFETISGSAAMAEEYNELAARKNQAEDKMSLIFTKKKATSSEKRQKKVQKQEAEQHMKLLEELRMFKAQRCIWEVYHLDKDIEEAMEGIKKLEEEAGRASEEAAGVDEAIKEKEVEYVSHNRERLAADRRVKKLQAEADKGRPGLIQIQEEIVRVNRRIKAAGKEIEEKSASLKEKEEKIHRLKQSLH